MNKPTPELSLTYLTADKDQHHYQLDRLLLSARDEYGPYQPNCRTAERPYQGLSDCWDNSPTPNQIISPLHICLSVAVVWGFLYCLSCILS